MLEAWLVEMRCRSILCSWNLQVYAEVDQAPEAREFNSVLTATDMYDQLRLQTKEVLYHRIPIWDDSAPAEKVGTSFLLPCSD